MCCTDALPGMAAAHEARVVVLHVTVLLDHLVAVQGQREVEKGGLGSNDHVGVDGEGVGCLGGPLEFFTETLGDLEGSGATDAKVLEGVLFDTVKGFSGLEDLGGLGDGVVGGSSVEEGDGVDVGKGAFETSLNDAGLVLYHQEEDEAIVLVGSGGLL